MPKISFLMRLNATFILMFCVVCLNGCVTAKSVTTVSPCSVEWEHSESPMQTTRPQMNLLQELSWVDKPNQENASSDIQVCKQICEDYRKCHSFIYRNHREQYPNLQTYHCWFYGENPTGWVYSAETPQSNNGAFIMDTWLVKHTECRE